MSSQIETVDDVITEFAKLSRLATCVMNEHANDSGLCVVCMCAWPCHLVVLADHNFDLSHQ